MIDSQITFDDMYICTFNKGDWGIALLFFIPYATQIGKYEL